MYAWFIWIALHDAPQAGWTIIIFLVSAVALTWPYFSNVMVPGFLKGLRNRQDK
jgi:hypothetical protein